MLLAAALEGAEVDDTEIQHIQCLDDHAVALGVDQEVFAFSHVYERRHFTVDPCEVEPFRLDSHHVLASGEVRSTVGFVPRV